MRKRPFVACSVAILSSAGAAHAGGLLLPGSGPVSTGRAGAAVASLDDPSAIGVNPAGLAGIRGTMIHVGSSFIGYHVTFNRAGQYDQDPDHTFSWEGQDYAPVSDESKPAIGLGEFQAVPVIAIASDLGGKVPGLVVAGGLFAPNAYPVRSVEADYVLEDPSRPPPPSRYDVVEQTAAIVMPTIAVAYRPIEELDVGARFSWGFGSIDATTYVWALNNFEEWAGRDGRFHVEASDGFIPSFGFGARYRPTPNIEVGASWSSALEFDGVGEGDSAVGSGGGELTPSGNPPEIGPPDPGEEYCQPGGRIGALKACVNFQLPQHAEIGGRYIIRDAGGAQVADVEVNVGWEQWSAASNQSVIVDGLVIADGNPTGFRLNPSTIRHNFQDTFSFRLGGSYQRVMGPGLVTLRGGAAYDTNAAEEGWERMDIDGAARLMLMAGASLTLRKVRIDVGGGIVHEGTRTQGAGCFSSQPGDGCNGQPRVPPDKRTGPDPVQPLNDSGDQQTNPFNEGAFTSGYGLLLLGVTTWF